MINKINSSSLVLTCLLAYIFLGANPFQGSSGGFHANMEGSADSFKQIFIICLFIFSIAFVKLKKGVLLFFFNNKILLLFMFWCCASLTWSVDPFVSTKRFILFILIFFIIYINICWVSVSKLLNIVFYTVMVLSFINITFCLLAPSLAISPIGWTGVHGHKNTLGLVSAIGAILTLWYLINEKTNVFKFYLYSFVISIQIVLLVMSESKTSFILFIFSLAVMVGVKFNILRLLIKYISITFMMVLSLFVLDITFHITSFSTGLFNNLSDDFLTGRVVIWRFLFEHIQNNPFIGVGYGAFWGVGQNSVYGDEGWWTTKIGEGHSGYLDLLVTLGLVGLLLFLLLIKQTLTRCMIMISSQKEYIPVLSIYTFCLLHAVTESSFVNSTQAIWVVFLLSTVLIGKKFYNDN